MELKVLIPAQDLLRKLARPRQHVLVERKHLLPGDRMLLRLKAVEITQQEAKGVAQLTVGLRDPLHQVFAGRYILTKVHRGHPETDNLRPQTLRDVDRINAIAQAFGHGAPLLVEGPAGGRGHAVGRSVPSTNGAEQGRLKPTAMLIPA